MAAPRITVGSIAAPWIIARWMAAPRIAGPKFVLRSHVQAYLPRIKGSTPSVTLTRAAVAGGSPIDVFGYCRNAPSYR